MTKLIEKNINREFQRQSLLKSARTPEEDRSLRRQFRIEDRIRNEQSRPGYGFNNLVRISKNFIPSLIANKNYKYWNNSYRSGLEKYQNNPRAIRLTSRNDLSFENHVKSLQGFLGVKADGKFGPETERAYRAALDAGVDFNKLPRDFGANYL